VNRKGEEYGTLIPATKRKRVLIVGGGPAGMEAAWIAKLRGQRVTLVEKSARLGGQLRLPAVHQEVEPGRSPTLYTTGTELPG